MGNIILQAIMLVASVAYQRKKQKEMERKMDEQRGSKFTIRGEAAPLPLVYGRQIVAPVESFHKVSADYTAVPANPITGEIDFSNKIDGTTSITGTKNEFLFVQGALCYEGINDVKFVNVNDRPYSSKAKEDDFKHRILVSPTGGTPTTMASANGIPTTNKFTGCTHVTSVFRLNREEPNYQGVPDTQFLVEGMKVSDIQQTAGVYGLSAAKTFSTNPALILLDYLTNSTYGKGVNVDDIDLESFNHAKTICNTVVMSNAAVYGRVHNTQPVLDFDTFADFPAVGNDAFHYLATDTGQTYAWTFTNVEEQTGSYSNVAVGGTRDIPLYECNMVIDTTKKIRDNIGAILETMGMAELIWSSEGKYKLLLEYPNTQEQEDNLIPTSHVFDDDSIIRDTIDIIYPSAAERLNSMEVTFDNEFEDFKRDSVTFPTLNGTLHNAFLQDDNYQPMKSSMTLTGITDPYHAKAKAEQLVRESRNTHSITFTATKKALKVEPGDFIKVNMPDLNISNETYRVDSMKVMEDLTVKIEAFSFNFGYLAWNIADDEAFTSTPGLQMGIPGPTALTFTDSGDFNEAGIYIPAFDVDWDDVDDATVTGYEVQFKLATDAKYTSYRVSSSFYKAMGVLVGQQYEVRVRSVDSSGRYSAFATGIHTVGGDSTAPSDPTNFTATGGFKYITLEWTNPAAADLSHVEIWESENPPSSLGSAVKVGETRSNNFVRANLDVHDFKTYWIRAIDTSGNVGNYVGPVDANTTFLDDPDFENGIYSLFTEQGLYAIEDVNGLPATGAFDGEKVYNRTDGKMYTWNGTSWDSLVPDIDSIPAANITGKLQSNQIALDAITEDLIAPDAVGAAQLASGAVGPANLQVNSVSEQALTIDAVRSDNIIAGAVIAGKIAVDAVTSNTIAAGAVVAGKIGADAITANEIASNSITANEIAANAITASELAANSVTAANIVGNTITGDKISANTITGGLLATSGIITNSAQIGDLVVENAKIKNAAIDTLKVAGEAVTHTNNARWPTIDLSGIQSSGGSYNFTTGAYFKYPGRWLMLANLVTFGTASSGDKMSINLYMDNTISNTGGVHQGGVTFTGSSLLGLHTFVGEMSISTTGWHYARLEVSNLQYITNPAARADLVQLWRYR